jgi:hypothetical protein
MIRAIIEGIKAKKGYQTTMLTGCLRKVYFEKTQELYPEIDTLYSLIKNTSFREHLKYNELDFIHEIALKKKIQLFSTTNEVQTPLAKVTLEGNIAEVNFRTGLIRNYIPCETIPFNQFPLAHHALHLNICLYLLQEDTRWLYGWDPQIFEIVYIDMSRLKRCPVRVFDYIPLDIYIKDSLLLLHNCLTQNASLPLINKKDLWQCESCITREICEKKYIKEIKEGRYDEEKTY